MPIAVGWQPIEITPIFSKGEDWTVTFEPVPGSVSPVWPAGATVVANVYPHNTDQTLPLAQWPVLFAWPGVISGDNVSFKGPSADADTVPQGSLMRVRASLPNTPTPDSFTWLKGMVERDD